MSIPTILSLTLSRRQMIRMMIDRQEIRAVTDKGEKIIILITGKVWESIKLPTKDELCHNFSAKIRLKKLNSWFHVVLTTTDNQVFVGKATLQ